MSAAVPNAIETPRRNQHEGGGGDGDGGGKQPAQSNKHSTKAGNILYGRTQFFIAEHLPVILSKKNFHLRRKPAQRDDTSKLFLSEIARRLQLKKTIGPRRDVEGWIVNHCIKNSNHFEREFGELYDVELYNEAKRADEDTRAEIDQALRGVSNSKSLRDFGPFFLSTFFRANQCGLCPTPEGDADTIFYNDHEFRFSYVVLALAEVDTTPWEADGSTATHGTIRRKTPACTLRLFLILIMNDDFFQRLKNEAKATPNREQLVAGARTHRSDFWADALVAFKNNHFPVPDCPDHAFFRDSTTREFYDVSTCRSAWATERHIRRWYNDAHNGVCRCRADMDRSGNHAFTSDNLTLFIENFAHGDRDACFLAGLGMYRGDDAVDWFNGTINLLPEKPVDGLGSTINLTPEQLVDGLGPPPPPPQQQREGSGGSAGHDTNSHGDEAADEANEGMNLLATAIERHGDSKEARAYYSARASESRANAALLEARASESRAKERILVFRERAEAVETDIKSKRLKLNYAKDLFAQADLLPPQYAQRIRNKASAILDEVLEDPPNDPPASR